MQDDDADVTAPHGRPNLRSQLHFCHPQEGRPRSLPRTCGALGGGEMWICCGCKVTMAQSENGYICQCNINCRCKLIIKGGCYHQNLFANIGQEKPFLYCKLKQVVKGNYWCMHKKERQGVILLKAESGNLWWLRRGFESWMCPLCWGRRTLTVYY